MCVYIYIYIYTPICIYIYIYREREIERHIDKYICIYIYVCMYIYIYIYTYGSSHLGPSDLKHFNRPFWQGWAIRAEAPPNNSLLPPPSAFIPISPLLLRLQLHHLHRLAKGGLPEPLLHFLLCNLLIVILSQYYFIYSNFGKNEILYPWVSRNSRGTLGRCRQRRKATGRGVGCQEYVRSIPPRTANPD